MPDAPDLSFAIGLPPERAMAYFRAKGYAVTFDWREMAREAHAKAFTVAKAARLDILSDIRGAVDKALTGGGTLAMFQRDLEPTLRAKGWWGRREVTDPRTGEVRAAQLGGPHRLATIYRTNLSTAYAAGRYREQLENADLRPYARYVAVLDAKTRPSHRALHNKVFPVTDPFWKRFYPPIDWGCRCRVETYSAYGLQRLGLEAEDSGGAWRIEDVDLGDGFSAERAIYTDPRTGDTVATGPGWAAPPDRWPLTDKAGGLPDCVSLDFADQAPCIRVVPGQPTWKDLGRPDLRTIPSNLRLPDPGVILAGQTRAEAISIMATALGLDRVPMIEVVTPIDTVILRAELLAHLTEKEADARERYARYIVPTLTSPFEIWLTEYEDGFRQRYIGLFQAKNDLMTVIRVNKDGSLLWNIMQAQDKNMNKMRLGRRLLHQK